MILLVSSCAHKNQSEDRSTKRNAAMHLFLEINSFNRSEITVIQDNLFFRVGPSQTRRLRRVRAELKSALGASAGYV